MISIRCTCPHLERATTASKGPPVPMGFTPAAELRKTVAENFRCIRVQFHQRTSLVIPSRPTRSWFQRTPHNTCQGCFEEGKGKAQGANASEDLMVCLHCMYMAGRKCEHLDRHFLYSKHFLAVHATRGEIYCFRCGDYVYDLELEVNRRLIDLWGREADRIEPRRFDMSKNISHWSQIQDERHFRYLALGLRGLYNLGNTCFMNCILQCLLHNPLLSSFFLSLSHPSHACQKSAGPSLCLACEIQRFFLLMHNIYDPVKDSPAAAPEKSGGLHLPHEPLAPHRLLHAVWSHTSGEHLAGYEQQDAHEFLIALLDALDMDLSTFASTNGRAKPPRAKSYEGDKTNEKPMNCVHSIFRGTLRSDVICSTCKSVSTVYEPFMDLSIPLEKHAEVFSPRPSANSKFNFDPAIKTPAPAMATPPASMDMDVAGDSTTKGAESPTKASERGEAKVKSPSKEVPITVYQCLEWYTGPEMLSEPIECTKCGVKTVGSKQLTIHRLPKVLVLHLKRFDSFRAGKIERFVKFDPKGLNMAPYVYRWRSQAEIHANESRGQSAGEILDIPYDLFAVAEHRGSSIQQGHYKAYVKAMDEWFVCNDAKLTLVEEEEVLKSQGYLLFYINREVLLSQKPL